MSNVSKDAVPDESNATHKVIMTVLSSGRNEIISVSVKYEPDIEGKDIVELGFLPASYQFVEEYILPAIEQGYMEWEAGPLLNMGSPSKYNN